MTNPYGGPPSGPQPQQPYGPPSGPQPAQPYGAPGAGMPPAPGQPAGFNAPPPPGGYQPGEMAEIPGVGVVRLASLGNRLLARLLDGVIIGIPVSIVSVLVMGAITAAVVPSQAELEASLASGETVGAGAGLAWFWSMLAITLTLMVATVLYEVAMIALRGATLGKQVLGVKVVREHNGAVPGWGPAFGRWSIPYLCNIVPCVGPIVALLCWLSPTFDSARRQGWHDKAAKTLVIATK